MAKPYHQSSLTSFPTENASAHARPGHNASVSFARYACLAKDCDATFTGRQAYRKHTNTHNTETDLEKRKIEVPCNITLAELKAQYLHSNRQKQLVSRNAFYACPESDCNELASSGKKGYNRLLDHSRHYHQLPESQFPKATACKDSAITYLGSLDWLVMRGSVVNPGLPGRRSNPSQPFSRYACLDDNCDNAVFQQKCDYELHMETKHKYATCVEKNAPIPVPLNFTLAQMKAKYLCSNDRQHLKRKAYLLCPEIPCNNLEPNTNTGFKIMLEHSKTVHKLKPQHLPDRATYKKEAITFLQAKEWVFMNEAVQEPLVESCHTQTK